MTRGSPSLRYVCLPDKDLERQVPKELADVVHKLLQGLEGERIALAPQQSLAKTCMALRDADTGEPTLFLSPLCSPVQRQAAQLLASAGLLESWSLSRWDPSRPPATLPSAVPFQRPETEGKEALVGRRSMGAKILRIGLRWLMEREHRSNRFQHLKPMTERIGQDLEAVWILHPSDAAAKDAAKRIKSTFRKVQCQEVAFQQTDSLDPRKQGKILSEIRKALQELGKGHKDKRVEFLIDLTTGREDIKSAMMSLALSGELPGKWIIGDGNGEEIDPADLEVLIEAQARKRDEKLDGLLLQHLGDTTRNSSLQAMRRSILLAAQIEDKTTAKPAPILLEGPTGSGKTHLAKALYEMMDGKGAFVHLNCSELAGDPQMMLSRLFGHVNGAFTGASKDYAGAFAQAAGGILFLDEIGELSLDAQARLLTSLDRGKDGYTFTPLGATKTTASDFLLICGTNRDLTRCVQERLFREDLHHRIRTRAFVLPSLRERLLGVPAKERGAEALELLERTWGKEAPFVDAQAEAALCQAMLERPWDGNFRELQSWSLELLSKVQFGRLTANAIRSCKPLPPPQARSEDPRELSLERIKGLLEEAGPNHSKLYRLAVEAGLRHEVAPRSESAMGKRLRKELEERIGE